MGFVRGHLELVEEKLRIRGADPAVLLGDFRALDQGRREAITVAETLKARRNELSQKVGALKKSGQDATALMDETRALKDKLDELDKTAAALDDQMRLSLARIRVTMPCMVISMTSSISRTGTTPMTCPLRSLVRISLSPLPPASGPCTPRQS